MPNHPWFAKAKWLKSEPYSADRAAILQAVSRRHPAKWQRSVASSWRAVTAPWTADEIAARIPWLLVHAQMSSPEFVLTQDLDNSSAPLLKRSFEPFSEPRVNASVAHLMRARAPDPSIPYAYGSVTLGGEKATPQCSEMLREEVEPTAPLHIDDVPPLDADDELLPRGKIVGNETVQRLWLGGGGVLSRTHFDRAHNLFVQLRGRKTVLLFEPDQIPHLHLYPAVHVARRQSQVVLDTPPPPPNALSGDGAAPARFPLSAHAAPLRVDLSAGELLYIPPYWAHTVLSIDPSLSLAHFSTSWEEARWSRHTRLQMPFGGLSSRCQKARGAAGVILAMLSDAHGSLGSTPQDLLSSLFASRFAPLYAPLDAPFAEEAADELTRCLLTRPDPAAPEVQPEVRLKVREAAAVVARLLREPDTQWHGRRYPAAIARELGKDFVEELAAWACGPDDAWLLLRLLARHPSDALIGAAFSESES